jgi:hypothetical protein
MFIETSFTLNLSRSGGATHLARTERRCHRYLDAINIRPLRSQKRSSVIRHVGGGVLTTALAVDVG